MTVAPIRETEKPQRNGAWVPWFVGALSLLLTGMFSVYVAITSEAKDRARFTSSVQRSQNELAHHLETYITLLRGLSGHFAATQSVTRDDFRAYVDQLELRVHYAGVQGIGFSKRVPPENREALIAVMQRQGMPSFRIWPEYERSEYHTVIYLEPENRRNVAALGYDMFTEPIRRAAVERARDTGMAAASGKVTLVQEIDEQKQAGFLIILPVYRGGRTPETVAERRAALEGFIFSAFRIDDLLAGIFGTEVHPDLAVDIFDGTELTEEQLLRRSSRTPAVADSAYRPAFTMVRQMEVAGRPWTLAFASRPGLEQPAGRSLAHVVAAAGLLITAVLFFLTRAQRAMRTVAERSAADLRESIATGRKYQAHAGAILESALDCILAIDAEGKVIEFNPAAERTFGFSRTEVLGKDLCELVIPPRFREAHRRGLAQFHTTGGGGRIVGKRFETTALQKNGTEFPIELAVARIDLYGALQFTAHLRDITDRRRTEAQLHEEAQTLATLNRIGSLLAADLDVHKLAEHVTDAAIGITGAQVGAFYYKTPGATTGRHTLHLQASGRRETIGDFQLPPNSLLSTAAFRGGTGVRTDDATRDQRCAAYELGLTSAAGALPVKSYLAVPVISRSGHMIGGLCFGHAEPGQFNQRCESIVAATAAQAAVAMDNAQLYTGAQEARKTAETANRLKDEFLATLSHELRTPLNAILGWSQLLRDSPHDAAQIAQGLERIERNAWAQAQLISDLLDVSRIISGNMRLDMRPVDLVAVIDAAVEAVAPTADAKGICIDRVLEPLVVRGDRNRLQQVLWNLLSNAVKFTPAGGRVEARLKRGGSYATISVSDNGMGIRAEFLPCVFDRFRQFDSTTTRKHGGLGLGLAIVRHLVELHGGTVSASSAGPGQGAAFVVTLPVLDVIDAAPATMQLPTATTALRAAEAATLQGVRVLVVEDDTDTRDLIRSVLESCDAKVTAVASARAAIDTFKHAVPHVLVSDIGMPEEDGYQLIRWVRALDPKAGGTVPALALTAFAHPEDRRRALQAGFQTHLSKPVGRDDLVAAVARLSGRSAARGATG